jgi:5-methylcytosine-specific restriction endonuclease McrA
VLRLSGSRQKTRQLKRAMIESDIDYKCSNCKQEPFWFGHSLTLDVDHINENWLDDRLENLRFLCPNCHSQFSRKLKDN